MSDLDRDLLRKLAEWPTDGLPVSSVYLDVDGRRHPRSQDVVPRVHDLARRLVSLAAGLDAEAGDSVLRDAGLIQRFVQEEFERDSWRGLVLFSCSGAGLWREVRTWRPVPDRATVAEGPLLLPLEVLVETYGSFCTVLVDRSRARIFRAELGRIEEGAEVVDEVAKHHEQGGWMQSRLQRRSDEMAERHYRHVAGLLLRQRQQQGFDHLILAGPDEAVHGFEHVLHDYLRQRVVARETLALTASAAEVLERTLAVEDRLVAERERRGVEHLRAEASAGRAAVVGLEGTLRALEEERVRTLVIPLTLRAPGVRCQVCGRLAASGVACATCGGPVAEVPDVMESAFAAALRQGAGVEAVMHDRDGTVGALLRF